MHDPRLLEEFPPVSTGDWDAAVRADLKGADYDATLLWRPGEPFAVKPYYRAEDLQRLALPLDSPPGAFPFVRGVRAGSNAWEMCEEIPPGDGPATRTAIESARSGGADAVALYLSAGVDTIPSVPLDREPIHLRALEWTPALVDALPGGDVRGSGAAAAWRGTADVDPLGALAELGESALSPPDLFTLAASAVRRSGPALRALCVRGRVYGESGGGTTQQLAFMVAHGAEYLAALSELGVPPGDTARALFFTVSIGPNYFFEIAKLRAARLLWSRVVTAFGVSPGAAAACIHARTCLWNKTRYDAHVNILRATSEAMSAILGGCDTLIVGAHTDGGLAPDSDARRLARNTQLILKHEAHLDYEVDPAGGSYYVEVLTDALAREAWSQFQQVAAAGGYLAALRSGTIQREIARSREQREHAYATRRQALVGTNQYPEPNETTWSRAAASTERASRRGGAPPALAVEPLRPWRAAARFEALRERSERHRASGAALPGIVLLQAGDPRMRQARAAFCAGFFGCAGLPVRDLVVEDPGQAVRQVADDAPDLLVLCSSDPEYPALASALVPALRAAGVRAQVLVAGYPRDALDDLRCAGVTDFIHRRSHPLETLSRWQDALGVKA